MPTNETVAELVGEAVPYMFQRFRDDVLSMGFRELSEIGDTRPLYLALVYGAPYVFHRPASWFADGTQSPDLDVLSRTVIRAVDEYLEGRGLEPLAGATVAEERDQLVETARAVLEDLQVEFETRDGEEKQGEHTRRKEALKARYRDILASVAFSVAEVSSVSERDPDSWAEICQIADETVRRLHMRWIGMPAETLERLSAAREEEVREVEALRVLEARRARESTLAFRLGRWMQRWIRQ